MIRFCELGLRSNFSFLEGASHPEEITVAASRLGLSGIGLADRNTVAGVVRLHLAAKEASLPYRPGARLCFADATPDILAYPRDRRAWGRLCRLLSLGNQRGGKANCLLHETDLLEWGEGMMLAVMPGLADFERLPDLLARLREAFADHVHLGLTPRYDGFDRRHHHALADIARQTGARLMATNDALMHEADRRPLADVVTAIREHVTVQAAGFRLAAHAERHLKSPAEIARLLRRHPEAIANANAFFDALNFSLEELKYQYPDEAVPGETPEQTLRRLAYEGAAARYPDGISDKVRGQIEYELKLIRELEYEPYFLTVWDIVRFARSQGILCQGRGSAANSTVCFCIGITEVDPALTDLLFERFISPERREPPDIDVDFEHERREEVIQYIYGKYGRDHAGIAATVISYRARSAGRETAKAFGLSEDQQSALSGAVWGWSSSALDEREARAAGLDTSDPTTRRVLDYASVLMGFPRHLSQHVGGFVITRDRLDEVVPVTPTAMEGRSQVEWDKDDLDALGILKIDILALGMLTCIAKAFGLIKRHYKGELTLATIPKERYEVYEMICRADTLGVFQIESRAQMSMLPRLRPQTFYDLVIEVAIVRPGPIQGDMVHPYLRRRQGKEPVAYPSKELEEVLGRTLGVPLFQEQAMKIAIVAAGFTPSEADKLRRAMATFRRVGTIHTFQKKMVEGMVARGYEADFAERCFKQIEGFGEYGFPESHAASFALLVYASCWLKARHPDVFCAAILNSQPMGFYAPAQLVRDAREHGVEVREPDVNFSGWASDLEPQAFDPARIHPRHRSMAGVIRTRFAVRLGFHQVKGLSEVDMVRLVERRGEGYASVRDLWLRSGLTRAVIERLADADCFRSIGLDRRAALWAVRALDEKSAAERLPLFENKGADLLAHEEDVRLPKMPEGEHVIHDYRTQSLSLKAHPISFLRPDFERLGIIRAMDLDHIRNGARVMVAGLVLVRQRPGSAKGVIFMTIEDETGVANAIVWPKVFEAYRPVVMGARLAGVRGRVQKADGVIHVVAESVENLTDHLAKLSDDGRLIESLANADEVRRPVPESRTRAKPGAAVTALFKEMPELKEDLRRQAEMARKVMPSGRNFH
ncbi:error-prone DNA polymerase [Rhizobium sp. TRM95796]|uniref:error-prone DNA polymerase n=1 Tax=Rhizobium sp. TRM95796 TaxID=2979862 RepID=UPI0021E84238|nr:error-prone DNA polymerase [Rhizobium sp. TRM95796]MCV3765543.1 error-prone DNA polymerase [Rhizobium sp. TRM95796]